MTINEWLMIAIFIIGAGSLLGFFKTKKEGFGQFTTSVLLIIIVVTIASLMYAAGELEGNIVQDQIKYLR